MKINNPTKDNMTTPELILRWAQSVFKALTGGLTFGQPGNTTGGVVTDSAGIYNSFIPDNFDCKLLYIGAVGSGSALLWANSNTGQAFNHGLQRQPIGFFVVYKTKACDVYSTATPTKDTITLAITDDTAKTIVLIF